MQLEEEKECKNRRQNYDFKYKNRYILKKPKEMPFSYMCLIIKKKRMMFQKHKLYVPDKQNYHSK